MFVPTDEYLRTKYPNEYNFKNLNAVEIINSSSMNRKIPMYKSEYFILPTLNRSMPLIVKNGIINESCKVLKLQNCTNGFLYFTTDFCIKV